MKIESPAFAPGAHIPEPYSRFGENQSPPLVFRDVPAQAKSLALIVDDPEFFRGAQPIPIATRLPPLSSPVQVLGYPIGGERLSVTQGVLSRIEMTPYAQSQRRLLAAQIDAAINSGNSGGPVVRNGRLIGVAFQVSRRARTSAT